MSCYSYEKTQSQLDKFLAELLFLNILSVTFFLHYTIVPKFGCVRSMEYVVGPIYCIFKFHIFSKVKKCIKLNVLYEKFDFVIQQVLIDSKSK